MAETFRPRINFLWASFALALIALFLINSLAVEKRGAHTVIEIIVSVVLGYLTYLLWVRPKLVLHESVIEVINPLSKESIDYRDVISLETKWALTIVHRGGRTQVWVAPATGKRRWIADKTFGWNSSRIPLSREVSNDTETMSASLISASGQAAYMIRERIKRLH